MISNRKIQFVSLALAAFLAVAGCSTVPGTSKGTSKGTSTGTSTGSNQSPPLLSGEWRGDLTIPQDFSSNRSMTDTACDRNRNGKENISLNVHWNGNTAIINGNVECSVGGKEIYVRSLTSTSLDLNGDLLMSNGKAVGKATPVYFSADISEGKLTIVKFPTWDKVFFESNTPSTGQISLAGVFADDKTFADGEGQDQKASAKNVRNPASR